MNFIDNDNFPDPEKANDDGLLAVGGKLNSATLLKAYSKGIFPWYNEDDPVLWWSPDPRLVLYPEDVIVSKSMKQVLSKNIFTFTINKCFSEVIHQCRNIRLNREGTWINPDVLKAYTQLHNEGWAHSVEVWHENKLVGGLYGVWIEKIFFGESMFNLMPNASKAALIFWCKHLQQHNVKLIDCQVKTNHLVSMGAVEISRTQFLNELEKRSH